MAEACYMARATTKQQVIKGIGKLTLQTNEHGQYRQDAILLLQKGIHCVLVSRGSTRKNAICLKCLWTNSEYHNSLKSMSMKSLGHGIRRAVNSMTGTRLYLGARGLLLQHPMIYSRLMRMQSNLTKQGPRHCTTSQQRRFIRRGLTYPLALRS